MNTIRQQNMIHRDLCDVTEPKITVITPSLNHGRFLRETIESIVSQSYRNFEHIVIDGGSTDETTSILEEYPHIKWISEKDNGIVEAYQKGLSLARGRYIIQCCVSDGFVDKHWFKKCLDVLDADDGISLVWGLPQYMSEEGNLLNVSYQSFFIAPPPQKQGFLAFWLATGFVFPEGNYCVRGDIIKRHFPTKTSESYFQIHPHLGFMYYFMTQGYCPYFICAVANYGRTHCDQRGQRLKAIEQPAAEEYFKRVKEYRQSVLEGNKHSFRNAHSDKIGELDGENLWHLRKLMWRYKILESPIFQLSIYNLLIKIINRLRLKGG